MKLTRRDFMRYGSLPALPPEVDLSRCTTSNVQRRAVFILGGYTFFTLGPWFAARAIEWAVTVIAGSEATPQSRSRSVPGQVLAGRRDEPGEPGSPRSRSRVATSLV